MQDKPRYSRVSDIIQLIILMLSKLNGVSLDDIQKEFNVSRRTAERMRDSVLNILPQVDEIDTDERCKRWGFSNYSLTEMINFSADDIAVLENLKNNCDEVSAMDLQKIITKLKAFNQKRISSVENEIEFLLQSEGYAVKQTPNYKVDLNIVSTVRQAIKDRVKISAVYNGKNKLLSPLGLIFGEKIYLIAREEDKGQGEYNYLLHKLKDVSLTSEHFEPKGFDIEEFSKRSFGVYQGEIYNVKLKFSKNVCEDVMNFNFHPTQKIKKQDDGSVIVSFKASGDKHIIWHVFKWGEDVEILAPKDLKKKYKDYLQNILKGL